MKQILLLSSFLSLFFLQVKGQGNCTTRAVVVAGVECDLLQTATDLIMPCSFPTSWNPAGPLQLGDTLWIDYVPGSCMSFCMQGTYSDITCADTVGIVVNPVAPCNIPATIIQGVECKLIAVATDTLMPCMAPSWVMDLPVGASLNISYQPGVCGSFCMQGTSVELTCASTPNVPPQANCEMLVEVALGDECQILIPLAGGGPYFFVPCGAPSWVTSLSPGTRMYIGYNPLPDNSCNIFCSTNNISIGCVEIVGQVEHDTICVGDSIVIGLPWGTDMSWEWPMTGETTSQITVAPTMSMTYSLLTYSSWCPTCPPDTSYYVVHVENCNGVEHPQNALFTPHISPNPTADIINFDNFTANGFIEMIDLSGKVVLSVRGENIKNINVSDLANGLYFLKFSTSEGVFVVKLCKMDL